MITSKSGLGVRIVNEEASRLLATTHRHSSSRVCCSPRRDARHECSRYEISGFRRKRLWKIIFKYVCAYVSSESGTRGDLISDIARHPRTILSEYLLRPTGLESKRDTTHQANLTAPSFYGRLACRSLGETVWQTRRGRTRWQHKSVDT